MNASEKLDMQVKEELDGSAVVDLPESMQEPAEEAEKPIKEEAINNERSDDDESAEENSDLDDDDDQQGDEEELRAAKRQHRRLKKELTREKVRQSNHLITTLTKRNNELAQRLAELERRTSGAEFARLDKSIEDEQVRLLYARQKIKEATELGDGEALASAQEAWYESRRKLESLEHYKQKAVESASEPKQNVPKVDPSLQRHAADWMNRNPWYNPQAVDRDSKIAKVIDEELAADGWDPTSKDYWMELDNRLQNALPHRYTYSNDERSSIRKPRSVVTSSGKETASSVKGNQLVISPDRVRAMKEAGLWDDPQKRARAIGKYQEFDRVAKQNRN